MILKVWLATLLLPVTLVLPLTLAGADTLVSLDRGTSYEMSRPKDCDCWSARFFVTKAKGFEEKTITATLLGVSIGTQSSPELSTWFDNPTPYQVAGRLAAFDIATRKGVVMPHAVFDLILLFRSGNAQQRQTVQMTIPAAVLRQPLSLQVIRVIPFLGFTEQGFTPSLVLAASEKSRSPASVGLTMQERFSDAQNEYDGQLVFDSKTPVPQDGSTPFTYKLEGEFPLGVAKTNLIVTSRQLETSLTVPVEVRTRRVKAVLWTVIIVGLVLGFVMRTLLKQQVQYGELKQQAVDTLQELKQCYDKAADEVLRDRLAHAASDLDDALQHVTRRVQRSLVDAINTARRQLADAQADLQQRLATAKTAVQDFTTLTTTGWRISAAIASSLRQASGPVTAMNLALSSNDEAHASELLRKEMARLREFLKNAVPSWRVEFKDVLRQMEFVGGVLIDPARTTLQMQLKELQNSLDQMSDPGPESQLPDFLAAVRVMDGLTARATTLLASCAGAVKNAWTAINGQLKVADLSDPDRWSAIEKETNDYADRLSKAPQHLTEDVHVDIATAADHLQQSWASALLAQVAEDDQPAIRELLSTGQYLGAAQKIVELSRLAAEKKPADVVAGRAYRTPRRSAGPVERVVPSDLHGEVTAAAENWGPALQQETAQAAPIAFRRSRHLTFLELAAAKLIQWIISAIGLAIVGYLLFTDKFVGTGAELLTAFFWGFTTDIGLDALVSAAKAKPGG